MLQPQSTLTATLSWITWLTRAGRWSTGGALGILQRWVLLSSIPALLSWIIRMTRAGHSTTKGALGNPCSTFTDALARCSAFCLLFVHNHNKNTSSFFYSFTYKTSITASKKLMYLLLTISVGFLVDSGQNTCHLNSALRLTFSYYVTF